jgi:hypothetical protein
MVGVSGIEGQRLAAVVETRRKTSAAESCGPEEPTSALGVTAGLVEAAVAGWTRWMRRAGGHKKDNDYDGWRWVGWEAPFDSTRRRRRPNPPRVC